MGRQLVVPGMTLRWLLPAASGRNEAAGAGRGGAGGRSPRVWEVSSVPRQAVLRDAQGA